MSTIFPNEPVRKRGYASTALTLLGILVSSNVIPEQYKDLAISIIVLFGGTAGVELSRRGKQGAIGPETHAKELKRVESETLMRVENENILSSQRWEEALLEVQQWP